MVDVLQVLRSVRPENPYGRMMAGAFELMARDPVLTGDVYGMARTLALAERMRPAGLCVAPPPRPALEIELTVLTIGAEEKRRGS